MRDPSFRASSLFAKFYRLKFTYKGRTSTLQSSSDIASWIEERKKRFPTAARRVENNARLQQLRHEREEARQKQEERRQALKDERLLQRQLKTLERDKQAAAEKAKAKVEKLRRKLAKEERRAAKAEAKSFKRSAPMKAEEDSRREIKRRRRQSDLNTENVQDHFEGNIDSPDDGKKPDPTEIARSGSMARENYGPVDDSQATERIKEEEPSSLITGPLTPTSQPALPENEAEPGSRKEANLSGNPVDPGQPPGPAESTKAHDACTLAPEEVTRNVCSTASSDMSVSSDDTLSGGGDEEETSSSGSSSDSDSINGGPEIAISRRPEPRKIPPPKRNAKQDKAICRDFLRTGRCRRGKRCRWRHALPDRGQRKTEEGVLARPERKSLHQRVCILPIPPSNIG